MYSISIKHLDIGFGNKVKPIIATYKILLV